MQLEIDFEIKAKATSQNDVATIRRRLDQIADERTPQAIKEREFLSKLLQRKQ